jgi:predicted nucleic acid-binding protein
LLPKDIENTGEKFKARDVQILNITGQRCRQVLRRVLSQCRILSISFSSLLVAAWNRRNLAIHARALAIACAAMQTGTSLGVIHVLDFAKPAL